MGEYIVLNGVKKEIVRGFLGPDGGVGTSDDGEIHLFLETTPQNIAPTINKLRNQIGEIEFRILGYSNGMVLLHVFYPSVEEKEKEETKEVESIRDLGPTDVEVETPSKKELMEISEEIADEMKEEFRELLEEVSE